MVLPCVPCLAAVPAVGSSIATFFGLSATAIAVKRSLNKKNKNKNKKNKKNKNKNKKNKTRNKRGGGFKREEQKMYKEQDNCRKKCNKTHKIKRHRNISYNDFVKSMTVEEKQELKETQNKLGKCNKGCSKRNNRMMKTHKKKYSKENKGNNDSGKCCRCKYVKRNNKLFQIRGNYNHCAYDGINCCKDKKTIVKPKK